MRTDSIALADVSGRCRWCQCTARVPCKCGCSWANPRRSLCTACVEVDKLARTPAGRRVIARILQPLFPLEENGRRPRR